MTADQWQQIAAIYDEAVTLDTVEREHYLARVCGDDSALRLEVDSLLAQDGRSGPLDTTAWVADNLLVQPASLAVGTLIGPYRVEGILGEGGMGQVYRARDAKLGRSVALKVLPEHLAGDPERRARFLREARVLAALNHPHIAAIHGFEDSGSVHALVLELVEGPTLADRLTHGPIPLEDALAIAVSVIDALEAAHDAGIIHRDLKPANIKVRTDDTVKVLDFGLARLVLHEGDAPPERDAATVTSPAVVTMAGTILGTAAYMSPEQAKGRVADARSDVWAFGCVLYEMLSGQRPFAGEDVADTLAAVLRAEPDWTALPSNTPPAVHGVLRRCLQKDRRRRFAAIADVRLDLQEPPVASAPMADARRHRASLLPWLVAGAAVVLAAAAWNWPRATSMPPGEVAAPLRFTVAPPADMAFGGPLAGGTGNSAQLAMSPDGQHIAFVAGTPDGYHLFLRSLSTLTPKMMAGTEGATYPFWAPDSSAIGFFADGKVKRVPIVGGLPTVLGDAPAGRGGTWNRDGVLLFAPVPGGGGLRRLSLARGPTVDVTTPEPLNAEVAHRWPSFLPDGRHFLYTVTAGTCCPPMRPAMIRVGSLDPAEPTVDVVQAESSAFYSGGHLVFAKESTLVAQPFDLQTFRLTGEAVPLGERVSWEGSRYVSAAMSDSGTLVFGTGALPNRQQGTWFTRAGDVTGVLGSPTQQYHTLALSPDERYVAIALQTGSQSNVDLWLFDVANGNSSRLTAGSGLEGSPVWSSDSRRMAFQSESNGKSSIHVLTLDGRAEETLLDATAAGNSDTPTSWSPDGRLLAFTRRDAAGRTGIWVLPLHGERTPYPVVDDDTTATSARFSPDGRWLAFTSVERGRSGVFVQAFPGRGVRHPVSHEETSHPVWRADGKELYVLAVGAGRDGFITAIPIALGTQVETGVPQSLFRAGGPRFSDGEIYSVTSRGDRFLINGRPQRPSLEPLTVVLNWPTLLRPPALTR